MILTSIPDPEQVLMDLSDVLSAVWEALEAGIQQAREYFDARGLEPDAYLAADLTRFEAKRLLEQQQHEAEFELQELSNNGLRVRAVRNGRSYDLRIRRSDNGQLPAPQSNVMSDFYYQPVLAGIDLPHADVINLVALWETPRTYTHITAINLACPSAPGESRADVQAHWYTPVPHPATTAQLPIEIQQEQAEEQPITDLAIEPLPDEQTGTDDGGEND
jgi:hypothetical protein